MTNNLAMIDNNEKLIDAYTNKSPKREDFLNEEIVHGISVISPKAIEPYNILQEYSNLLTGYVADQDYMYLVSVNEDNLRKKFDSRYAKIETVKNPNIDPYLPEDKHSINIAIRKLKSYTNGKKKLAVDYVERNKKRAIKYLNKLENLKKNRL